MRMILTDINLHRRVIRLVHGSGWVLNDNKWCAELSSSYLSDCRQYGPFRLHFHIYRTATGKVKVSQ